MNSDQRVPSGAKASITTAGGVASPRPAVAVLHPELGIGGAERLAVDTGMALRNAGYDVTMFATQHNESRSFPATIDGRLRVATFGTWIPIHLFGRLRAVLSIFRMAWLSIKVRLKTSGDTLIFCSLLPFGIPFLRLGSRRPIIYYCHFPDLLLTPPRNRIYDLYRIPIDWLERFTTCQADVVCVNSQFTAETFETTIPQLGSDRLRVVYPGIDYDAHAVIPPVTATDEICLLSINRFDPDKQLQLAVEAFNQLRTLIPFSLFSRIQLVVAGGFDERLPWCSQILQELRDLAAGFGLEDQIEFVLTPSDSVRLDLLQRCRCLLYTPENEHFGLIPLEAMASARPVIASNSGGPRETIIHGKTGALCPQSAKGFAQAMVPFIEDFETARRFGETGRKHVEENFSLQRFQDNLECLMVDLADEQRR